MDKFLRWFNKIVSYKLNTDSKSKHKSYETTIHGIAYITDVKKTFTERIWWAIGFVVIEIICIYLISIQYVKWTETPVVVSFSKQFTPIWEIPFPAVTICPLRKLNSRLETYNFDYDYNIFVLGQEHSFTTEEYILRQNEFLDLALVCDFDNVNLSKPFASKNINSLLADVSISRADTVTAVKWKNLINRNPDELVFFERITSEGLCFTFNALSHKDMYTHAVTDEINTDGFNKENCGWSIDKGYPDDESSCYPDRTAAAGIMHGLLLTLLTRRAITSDFCGMQAAGYKMLLHNPAELPRINEQYFLVPTKKQMTISVKPKVMRTSRHLLNVEPHARGCFFDHEKKLHFFKMYTYNNCKSECEALLTEVHCECIPFYLPRRQENKVCGYSKTKCMREVKDLFSKYENMNNKYIANESEKMEYNTFLKCDCLPSCNYIDYNVDLSQAEYLIDISRYTINKFKLLSDVKEESFLNIFFSNSEFLAMEMRATYETIDFLANIGGLLGLFMGFTFLSFIELVYYLLRATLFKIINRKKKTAVEFLK